MIDQFGRNIDYVRLSLTDSCNLHCHYCRPYAQAGGRKQLLTYEELLRLAGLLRALDIRKFKITGGEPLLRQGCTAFLKQLRAIAEQLTLTTNGLFLKGYVRELKEMGLDGINISLDSCRPEVYQAITGYGGLSQVQEAIRAAKAEGLFLKLNCVPLKPFVQDDLRRLLAFAEEEQLPLRFIELMPLSCNQLYAGMTAGELQKLFSTLGYSLRHSNVQLGNGPAAYYEAEGLSIPIGFIEPIHGKFCQSCNRVRITADGLLKPCLYSGTTVDIGAMLRAGAADERLSVALEQAILHKPKEHGFELEPAGFSMNSIGG